MSWGVNTSYSRYCRQPATRSVLVAVQPVCAQNSSMQRWVVAREDWADAGVHQDSRVPSVERDPDRGEPAGVLRGFALG